MKELNIQKLILTFNFSIIRIKFWMHLYKINFIKVEYFKRKELV